MSEFTTIQVTKELKDKLTEIKKQEHMKYNDIIEGLLVNRGTDVDDVVTVEREPVAFSMTYKNDEGDYNVFNVTYKYLKGLKHGESFVAFNRPTGKKWINSGAQVIYHDGEDVVLLTEEVSYDNEEVSRLKSVVHVKLF